VLKSDYSQGRGIQSSDKTLGLVCMKPWVPYCFLFFIYKMRLIVIFSLLRVARITKSIHTCKKLETICIE
jgi:hypothetical protein